MNYYLFKIMTSPTKKSLDKFRKNGYLVEITEHWIPQAGVRKDLWGFCDLLAIKGKEIIAIQVTSLSNVNARVDKILKHKNYLPVKKSGIKILVQGFGKVKKDGRIVQDCKEIYL